MLLTTDCFKGEPESFTEVLQHQQKTSFRVTLKVPGENVDFLRTLTLPFLSITGTIGDSEAQTLPKVHFVLLPFTVNKCLTILDPETLEPESLEGLLNCEVSQEVQFVPDSKILSKPAGVLKFFRGFRRSADNSNLFQGIFTFKEASESGYLAVALEFVTAATKSAEERRELNVKVLEPNASTAGRLYIEWISQILREH